MPIPVSPAPQLSRTSSTSSIASVDTDASLESITSGVNADVADKAERRTRKRFTNVQLMMLEHLYHQTSHPSREQRDALAKGGDMEIRSVTIWFQNKRQTERRGRATFHNATNRTVVTNSSLFTSAPSGDTTRTIHTTPLALSASATTSTVATATVASMSPRRSLRRQRTMPLTPIRRPSLDHIAARAERPVPFTPPRRRTVSYPAPQTPPRAHAPALWESMPSSPLAPPPSPHAERALLDFGRARMKRMRTLEWACAAARVEGRVETDGKADESALVLDLGGDTEDEGEHEAVTPKSGQSLRTGAAMRNMRRQSGAEDAAEKENVPVKIGRKLGVGIGKVRTKDVDEVRNLHEDDVMDAALALCGLGGQ
ncbi:hypothetical protein AcW1_001395 [Taiwanofungus camphoratus]|nr:hypothetical protein AcV5_005322 [Antrodia cinnamomea]KAI0962616.1 hypothetical protein AcV7_001419 [Antrodia cinnamomea]KAI0964618.1 hypothetical protein AcW1_001395 [Antrodia cinnamomea]